MATFETIKIKEKCYRMWVLTSVQLKIHSHNFENIRLLWLLLPDWNHPLHSVLSMGQKFDWWRFRWLRDAHHPADDAAFRLPETEIDHPSLGGAASLQRRLRLLHVLRLQPGRLLRGRRLRQHGRRQQQVDQIENRSRLASSGGLHPAKWESPCIRQHSQLFKHPKKLFLSHKTLFILRLMRLLFSKIMVFVFRIIKKCPAPKRPYWMFGVMC